MSIQTEIDRISGNVSAALSAIVEKGVTVPDGSTSDALAELITSIEVGGHGINATAGTITVSSDVNNYELTHNLGEVPKLFFIGMIDKFSDLAFTGKKYLLVSAHGFSDAKAQYRISANARDSGANAVFREYGINAITYNKTSLSHADEKTIRIADNAGTYKLIAGATYYWVAVGSGVF